MITLVSSQKSLPPNISAGSVLETSRINLTNLIFHFLFQCLDAELAQDQAEIEKLAVDINNAIVGVPDVDQILADTADNVLMATDLKNEAEAVQKEAKTQLDIAEKIIRELSNAAVSQDAAEEAVIQTWNDIDSAGTNLGQVSHFWNFSFGVPQCGIIRN